MPHLPALLRGGPDPAPQDAGPQGTGPALAAKAPQVWSPSPGLGRREPRLEAESERQSLSLHGCSL